MNSNNIKISPSILAADFANLEKEVKNIDKAGADYIHIDVMDGNFVPPITIGSDVVKSLRKHSNLPFDVHLMVDNPDKHIADFAHAGADIMTIHAESCIHLDRSLKKIKDLNKMAGISLVPSTNESILDYIIEEIDLILIMTVNPGYGGQEFIESQLNKIKNCREKIIKSNKNIRLEVDGGINEETAKKAIANGADTLVAGSYIFNSSNYQQAIAKLRN